MTPLIHSFFDKPIFNFLSINDIRKAIMSIVAYEKKINQCTWKRLRLIGLSRFCSEKAKKLLRNMPKSCSKVAQKFCKVAQIFLRQYV